VPSENGHNLTEICKGISHKYIIESHWKVLSNHSTVSRYMLKENEENHEEPLTAQAINTTRFEFDASGI
jgi:hypothetical protein